MTRHVLLALGVLTLASLLGPVAAQDAPTGLAGHMASPETLQRLESEGWPVRLEDGRPIAVPTTDVACTLIAQEYRRKRQRLLDWSQSRRHGILADAKTTQAEKDRQLGKLRDTMLKRGRVIGKKYYAPVVMYLAESVNYAKRGSGGADARMKINLAIGVSPGSDKWQGAWSDIDLQGSPRHVDEFRKRMEQIVGGADVDAGAGYLTEQTLDVTLHKMGGPGMEEYSKVGSSAYEEKIRVDADSPETSNSALMARDQEGRVLVEVNDYMKKSEIGLKTDPLALLQRPMELKGMAKGIYKTLNTVPMSSGDVQDCLRRSGLDMDAGDFRSALERLKLDGMAFTPESVGITPENIEGFQKSIETLFVTCHEKVRTQARAEMASLKQKILVAEGQGNGAEATRLRKRYIDSQMRIVESTEANRRRYLGCTDLGPTLKGIRGEIPPVHGQMKVRSELARFLSLMKGGRVQRRIAVLVLNHIAARSPESARAALDAAIEMDADGVLHDDPEVAKLRSELQHLQEGKPGRSALEREAALLAFANRCRTRVTQLNAFLAADLKRSRTGTIAGAVVDKWGGVEEALAYWHAFEADGLEGLATEIVRFRVPLVENLVSGRPLLAAWEVVCMVCPQAGIYYAAFNYTQRLTLMGVDHFWTWQLDGTLDELYRSAEWERAGTEKFGQATVARWKLVRTQLGKQPLLRSDFLVLSDGATLGSVELETVLRLTVAKEDAVLRAIDEVARHPDVGKRLLGHLDSKYEERWEKARAWWAKETLKRLEERKQAEEALLGQALLPIMFQLDHVLAELEVENLVRSKMYLSEYTKSEKAWMFWVSVRTSLSDGSATLFSEADDAANAIVQQLAAKEIRYLRQYREVQRARQRAEELTGLDGARDGPLRQLTGAYFLLGDPEQDLVRARHWERTATDVRSRTEEQLLSIKRGFFPQAALDTEFDARILAGVVAERAWFEAWGQAHKVLTTWHSPEEWSTARDLLAPFYSREKWHDAFLAIWDEAAVEVRQLAKLVLSEKTYPTMRRQHRTRADALIAEFRAHYAGEARGRALVHVRLLDGTQRTERPITGCSVSYVTTSERAVETRPGTYEFRGLPAGFCRVLAEARGFTDGQGNPAAAANLTIPQEPSGPPPSATLYLRPDEVALTGSVVDDRDRAVAHAEVTLRSGGSVRQAPAAGDGSFAFAPVKPGEYRIAAAARGYLPVAEQSAQVVLPTAAGEGPAPVRFALTPMLSTVELVLRDEHGVHVEGARVSLEESKARSDHTGTVVFANVRPDPAVRVQVAADGYATLRETLAVLPATEPSTIRRTLTLSGGVALEVSVRELESRSPVRGATVRASHASEIARATSDAEGRARLAGLSPSFVYVTVEGDGFGTRGNIEVDLRDVQVGETGTHTVFVEFGMRLDVLVKDGRGGLVPGAVVSIDGGPDRFAPTGTATFVPVTEGEHVVRAKAPGFTEAVHTYVAVPLATQKDSLSLTLQPGISVRAEVRDRAGALLRHPRSTIRLIRNGEIVATAPGPVHLFGGLTPGTYLAGAAAPGAGISMSERATLADAPAHQTLTVRLGLLFALQVRLRSADGSVRAVPEHASVELTAAGRRATAVGQIVQFDGMLPGIYTIRASAPGFEPASRSTLFPATEEGQVLGIEIVLTPIPETAPPPPPPASDDVPPPGPDVLEALKACDGVNLVMEVPVRWKQVDTDGEVSVASDTCSFSFFSHADPAENSRVQWAGRLLIATRNETTRKEDGSRGSETETLRGKLSADGRSFRTLEYSFKSTSTQYRWTTVRDVPGQPSVPPTLESIVYLVNEERLVLRDLPLFEENGSYIFRCSAADLRDKVVGATKSQRWRRDWEETNWPSETTSMDVLKLDWDLLRTMTEQERRLFGRFNQLVFWTQE